LLRDSIMNNGTVQQKLQVRREEVIMERAANAAQQQPAIHEAQAASDHQMVHGLKRLAVVRQIAVGRQPRVLEHLDAAIGEVRLALAVN
jgi:hypothetical protein